MRSSRRRIRLGMLLAVAAGAWYLRHRQASVAEPAVTLPWPPLPPEPPPLVPTAEVSKAVVSKAVVSTSPLAAGWVGPCAGGCPETHPVKVKLRSGLFHLPGMALYDRTNADRCYASADDAGADGFRRSSR